MLIRIYFNCGEHLIFEDLNNSFDEEKFNNVNEAKKIKEYMFLVGTNSQEWLTALMCGVDEWYPKVINRPKRKNPIKVNLTENLPSASGIIMSNIVSAIYVFDEDAEKLNFYFITDNAEPRGIDPDHYKNKGVVIDLTGDEFIQWYRKGLEELQ